MSEWRNGPYVRGGMAEWALCEGRNSEWALSEGRNSEPDNQNGGGILKNTIAEFGMKHHFRAEFGVHFFIK